MIVKSKKTNIEQELSSEEWAAVVKIGLAKLFIVIDAGQSVKRKVMDFPEKLVVEEIKSDTKPISKKPIKKSI